MIKQFTYKTLIFGSLIMLTACTKMLAQATKLSNKQQIVLLRDSLDFKDKKVSVNTSSNEFSPIPYKKGLLYISNKPLEGAKVAFNKIYWTEDPSFKIIEKEINKDSARKLTLKYIRTGNNDDFTAPTSNDNNMLVNYKKIKYKWNEVELAFKHFSTEQAFSFNDSLNLLIYAKKSNKKINGVKHWELWQAHLVNGKLRNKKRILFEDRNADYLYPFIDLDGSKVYFASNKEGGKGGYDIYYSKLIGTEVSTSLNSVDYINSSYDEIAPALYNDSLYFSSNKQGGLGGFDIYYVNNKLGKSLVNFGYPLNTVADEVGFKKVNNDYYLTTNRKTNFDIYAVNFSPVKYPIQGVLKYKNDSSLAVNHLMYVKDVDADLVIDTLTTNNLAAYSFIGKPNRTYEFNTLNGDSVFENIDIRTFPNQLKFDYALLINGRSPKQRADSINSLWAKLEQKRQDSIAAFSLSSKFIVHYGFNKSTIVSKEQLVLDSLLIKLNKMPSAYIVVGAFTDCIGSYKYNYKLSLKRGKSVVSYLIKHGLDKNRIVSNGYSKKYSITPCTTRYSKNAKNKQQDSRRAEIVLSDIKKTDWATLEKKRGSSYYAIYDAKNAKSVPSIKLTQLSIAKVVPVVKKDTVVVAKPIPVVIKKDTVAKVIAVVKPVVPVVKKDTVVVAKAIPVVVKKDTVSKVIAIVKPVVPVVKKDTVVVAKTSTKTVLKAIEKEDSLKSVMVNAYTKKQKDTIAAPKLIIAKASEFKEEDDMTKEEIIKALDSLAKLKREQERIVEYLTKRINKKPIDVFVNSDSVTVELYDNGIHDKDSVSVIYNNRIVVDREELKVNKPIKFQLKVDKNKKNNELVLVAENLGTEPPNTAVMFITEKSGRRQQVMLSTDMTHNEVVYFIRIGKE